MSSPPCSRKHELDADGPSGRLPDQRALRADEPINDLAEFLSFLAELEAAVGPVDREPAPMVGTRFRL